MSYPGYRFAHPGYELAACNAEFRRNPQCLTTSTEHLA
ncbi:hypothetical protein ACVIN2_007185 [Bradyrhizobium sp. USDA 3650]